MELTGICATCCENNYAVEECVHKSAVGIGTNELTTVLPMPEYILIDYGIIDKTGFLPNNISVPSTMNHR